MGMMTQSQPSLVVLIACGIASTTAIMCYECVWIKGRTEDDCFYMPQHVRKKFLVNCDDHKNHASDEDLQFTHCETAIACLDRGFGKRASLHRTCSIGPAGVSEGNETATMKPGMTSDTTTVGGSTDSTTVSSRRKRADGSSPAANTTAGNSAPGILAGNATVEEPPPPSGTCSKLGDGETADGVTFVYNLTVCFCDSDECNVHSSETRLKNQIIYAADVCNDAHTFQLHPATLLAILLTNFWSRASSFQK